MNETVRTLINPVFTVEVDGEVSEVALEAWVWEAHYSDGTVMYQYDPDTLKFHRFGEIIPDNLTSFVLRNAENPVQRVEVVMSEGMRPIHFYRNSILNIGTPEEVRVRTWCIGYQETIRGVNFKAITQVFPDGTLKLLKG